MKRIQLTLKSGFRLVAQGIIEAYEDKGEIASFQDGKLLGELLEFEKMVNANSPRLRLHIELSDKWPGLPIGGETRWKAMCCGG